MTALHSHHRTSLTIGWEAARANLAPALLIQVVMLALLAGYYFSPAVAALLNDFAVLKDAAWLHFRRRCCRCRRCALAGVISYRSSSSMDVPTRQNLRNLLFTVPIWAIDGSLVDLLYRSEAAWLGNVVTFPVVLAKICVDQFGYNPFFAAPFGVLTYEWKNTGFSLESLGRGFTWRALPRQDRADPARHLGGLDSAYGHHLLAPARFAVPALQPGAHFLGLTPYLHDQ